MLASRLNVILLQCVRPDQTGFLKDSYLGDNVRRLVNLIDYVNQSNDPTVCYFIKTEKAFNCIEWEFIRIIIEKWGLEANFLQWINLLYSKQLGFLRMEGFLSPKVSIL